MFRNKVKYAVFLIFLLLLAILYNEYITLLVFAVFLLIPVILLILNFIIRSCLTVESSIEKSVIEYAELSTLTVKLNNRSWFPITRIKVVVDYRNQFCGKSKHETVMMSIDAHSLQNVAIDILSDYCGNIEYKIDKVYIYDVFGIWRTRIKYFAKHIQTVLPAPLELFDDAPAHKYSYEHDGEEYSPDHSGDDVSELFDVREYRSGDSYKRIHRKLSAKMDELYVKEFGLPVDCTTVMLCDLKYCSSDGETLEYFDGAITCMFAAAVLLLEEKIPFYLVWYDGNTSSCRREKVEDEETFYEVLSHMYESAPRRTEPAIAKHYMAEYANAQCLSAIYIGPKTNMEDYMYFCENNRGLRDHHAVMCEDNDWKIYE